MKKSVRFCSLPVVCIGMFSVSYNVLIPTYLAYYIITRMFQKKNRFEISYTVHVKIFICQVECMNFISKCVHGTYVTMYIRVY